MRALPFLIATLAACGGSAKVTTRPLGVEGHLDEARRHDSDAEAKERIAHDVEATSQDRQQVCTDMVLADQAHSGGEPLVAVFPCWTREQSAADRHRDEAARLRADAHVHRVRARALVEVERQSCATMPDDELDHTPFAHREDIVSVVAELDGDEVRGARIRFRPVEGLTAEWLRTAIGCHQARAAALGHDPAYMAYDPSVVPGAEVAVSEDADGVVVVLRGSDDASALAVYGRAEELVGGSW
jgi:hypothetical protein